MSELSGPTARTVARMRRWWSLYTADLPSATARIRRDELESDLHEQLTYLAHRGRSDRTIARAIGGRALRGVAADLAWRRAQLRALPAEPNARHDRHTRGLLSLTFALGILFLVWGGVVLVRWATDFVWAGYLLWSTDLVFFVLALAVCASGLVMLSDARVRWLGCLCLMASASVLIDCGFAILADTSVTAAFLVRLVPGWSTLELAVSAGATMTLLGGMIWWLPVARRVGEA